MVLGILNSTRLFRWTQHKFHHAHPGSVFVPNLRFGTTGPDEGTYIAVSNTSPNLRRYQQRLKKPIDYPIGTPVRS